MSPPLAGVRAGTGQHAGSFDGRSLKDVEIEHILSVLNKHQGNKPAAANELGISLKTLYNRLNALNEEKRAG